MSFLSRLNCTPAETDAEGITEVTGCPLLALLRRYGAELACPVYVRKRKFETELVVLKRGGGSAHYAPTSPRSQVPIPDRGAKARRVSSVLNTLWGSMRPFRAGFHRNPLFVRAASPLGSTKIPFGMVVLSGAVVTPSA